MCMYLNMRSFSVTGDSQTLRPGGGNKAYWFQVYFLNVLLEGELYEGPRNLQVRETPSSYWVGPVVSVGHLWMLFYPALTSIVYPYCLSWWEALYLAEHQACCATVFSVMLFSCVISKSESQQPEGTKGASLIIKASSLVLCFFGCPLLCPKNEYGDTSILSSAEEHDSSCGSLCFSCNARGSSPFF